jgi:hypothetical protein
MQMCTIYEREQDWFFQSLSKTVTGLWIANGPILKLEQSVQGRKKADALLACLSQSRQGVPNAENPRNLVLQLLESARVKGWASFMNRAKCIIAESMSGRITLTPQRKLPRPKGSMESLPDLRIDLPFAASSDELGLALEEAMSRSI